jgi:hypothetical protein
MMHNVPMEGIGFKTLTTLTQPPILKLCTAAPDHRTHWIKDLDRTFDLDYFLQPCWRIGRVRKLSAKKSTAAPIRRRSAVKRTRRLPLSTVTDQMQPKGCQQKQRQQVAYQPPPTTGLQFRK